MDAGVVWKSNLKDLWAGSQVLLLGLRVVVSSEAVPECYIFPVVKVHPADS